MNNHRSESERVRRFFNRVSLIYPIIERALFPEYKRALRKLDLDPSLTVLDLATGTGILAAAFAQRGHNVKGLDIAERMLRRAQKKYPRILFEHSDIRQISALEKSSFGIVAMGYFLHGVEPDLRLQVLKNCNRIAGKYVIIFDYCCKGNWLVDLIEWVEGSYYKQFVSSSRVDELSAAGLMVEREINLSDYGSVWLCTANNNEKYGP